MEASGALPPPPALPRPASGLSGRLASLAETAKAYARSAQADNTRRAYAADWKMFASWLRRQGLSETPPDPEAVGLYLAAQVQGAAPSSRSPPSSGGCRASPGATVRSANRSTSATGISPLCWPASAAATLALPCRRPPSSPMSFWPCWRRWRWICVAFATAPFSLSALRAVCAVPRSLGSIVARTRLRTAPAGSKSSPRAPCSPSVARLGGARSRSARARDRRPVRSPCSKPGCGSGGSPAAPWP